MLKTNKYLVRLIKNKIILTKQIIGLIIILTLTNCANNNPILEKGQYKGYYKVGKPYQINSTWYYPQEDIFYSETGIASWYGPNFHGKLTANGDIYNQNALTAAHRTLPMPSYVRVTNLENGKTIILLVNDRGPYAKNRIIDVSKKAADILEFQKQGITKVKVDFLAGKTKHLLQKLDIGHESMLFKTNFIQKNSKQYKKTNITIPRNQQHNKQKTNAINEIKANQQYYKSADNIVEAIKNNYFVQVGSFKNIDNAKKLAYKLLNIGESNITPVGVGNDIFYRVIIGPYDNYQKAENIVEKIDNIIDIKGKIINLNY